MEFNYDQNNTLIGFTIENNEYFYIRDILGNILDSVKFFWVKDKK